MIPRPPSQLDLAKAVPILNVAGELGLEIVGNAAHCWRKANHAHADRRPSLGFDVAKNRYKCFVCDHRSGSVVDLVMGVLAISLPEALKWFARNFDIPESGPRFPDFDPQKVTLSTIVLSGVWASLSDSQRTILAVLWCLRDKAEGTVTASYSRILRLCGLSSRNTFAAVIRFFEDSRLIEVQRRNRAASTYRFIEHEDFLRLQRECQNLVRLQDTSLGNKETDLVSPEDTRCDSSELVRPEETSNPSSLYKGLCIPIGVLDSEFSERERQVLRVAARGFHLFPCKPLSKEPAVSNWRKLATADPKKLARWFADFPDANWAIATGRVSGIFVVDLDGEQGERSWSELCRENGGEVNTLTVRTPRGRHLYSIYPAGTVVRNSASKIAPGVDIRGEGGYVLCPPSIHPTGASYEWDGREDGSLSRLSLNGNGNGEKENLRCHVHGNHAEWWKRSDGDLVCERCHPNPAEVCVQ